MALPLNPFAFKQPLAPRDVLDFLLPLTKGATTQEPAPFLVDGEDVASFTMTTTAEAAAVGLQVKSGGSYGPSLIDNKILFWLGIAPAMQASSIFDGEGVKLGVELKITTTNNPPREKQRIIVVQVCQVGRP